jgi:hypothetical protein
MLTRIAALGALVLAAVGAVLAAPATAHADVIFYCPPSGGACQEVVITPGVPGSGSPGSGGGGGGSVPGMCQASDQFGELAPVPCYDPALGWYNAKDGCYYQAEPELDQQIPGPGNFYRVRCGPGRMFGGFTDFGSVRLPTPPPGFGGAVTPAVLAAQAINQLPIHGPAIGTAPAAGGSGLVGLPVWLWTAVTAQTWGPISATASVPGLSVTATANATKIVWSMGDGTAVVCTDPGTPYEARFGNTDSPTCGHRYRTSSRTQPGGRYTVTATTTWHVTWAGGGQSGVVDVTRTATTTVRIDELQVVTG